MLKYMRDMIYETSLFCTVRFRIYFYVYVSCEQYLVTYIKTFRYFENNTVKKLPSKNILICIK